jgi:hypothetical protein
MKTKTRTSQKRQSISYVTSKRTILPDPKGLRYLSVVAATCIHQKPRQTWHRGRADRMNEKEEGRTMAAQKDLHMTFGLEERGANDPWA